MQHLLRLLFLCGLIGLTLARPTLRQPHAKHSRRPDVDGFELTRGNATWYSVCSTLEPPVPPTIQPLASPIPQPMIDQPTSEVGLQIVQIQNTDCLAWGFFSDDIEQVGWSYLSIETNPDASDYLQSRAAGYLEGYLTQARIQQNVETLLPGFYPRGVTKGVAKFLNDTINFKLGMIAGVGLADNYWTQVANLYLQVQGLFEGYSAAVTNSSDALSWFDIYSLQLDVDLGDIQTAVSLFSHLATEEEKAYTHKKLAAKLERGRTPAGSSDETHCSALVKLLPGNSDLIVGHDTWAGYNTMLRMFKLYNMPLKSSVGAVSQHQSSYPGFLFSSDDWYQLTPSMLTVTETSNDIYNTALYESVRPGTVSIWTRTLIANRLATNGAEWAEIFGRYNSGTCDNQWIIVDHKLFEAGQAQLQPGLLTISEQMPGWMVTKDMTSQLQANGYWSSFNIPAFQETYIVSGYQHCTDGPYTCSYDQNYRFLLFQELQGKVTDLTSMQQVLMYNQWQTDPLQRNDSTYAIAARDDLSPSPSTYGGIDGKITFDSWMKQGNLRVSTVSGPTTETQAPFCWGGQFQQPPGQPQCFNFPWVTYSTAPLDSTAVSTASTLALE